MDAHRAERSCEQGQIWDAIVAATAVTANAALWTTDGDFAELRAKGLQL